MTFESLQPFCEHCETHLTASHCWNLVFAHSFVMDHDTYHYLAARSTISCLLFGKVVPL